MALDLDHREKVLQAFTDNLSGAADPVDGTTVAFYVGQSYINTATGAAFYVSVASFDPSVAATGSVFLPMMTVGAAVATATVAEFEDVADAINTTGKIAGKQVQETASGAFFWAQGPAAADPWLNGVGVPIYLPV